MSNTKKSARSTSGRASNMLTDEERAAMKETVEERRRARSGEADGESDVLAKIAEMSESDRVMAKRLHAIIKASAPNLSSKTWYGMPAYAKDGKIICFFHGETGGRLEHTTYVGFGTVRPNGQDRKAPGSQTKAVTLCDIARDSM